MRHDTPEPPKWQMILFYVAIGLFFFWLAWGLGLSRFGVQQPGAFLEATDYEAKVLVMVFPSDDTTKNYLIPADIGKGDGSYDKTYTVYKIYWPNGGYTEFDNCTIEEYTLKASCFDDDKEYFIQLTDRKA